MSDPALVLEILSQTLRATERILGRFEPVSSVAYFLDVDFDVCQENIPELVMVLRGMIADLNSTSGAE